jgi:putative oxidoreductase
MFTDFSSEITVAGRLLVGGAFAFAGVRNIQNRTLLTQMMSARGVPQAGAVLRIGIVLQIVTGMLLISGVWTAAASALLLLFLIAATPMFHNFWDYQGPDRASRINGFVSNVALAGGFLTLLAHPI